jgi:hypothetical protein
MFLNYINVWRTPDNAKTASARLLKALGPFFSATKEGNAIFRCDPN